MTYRPLAAITRTTASTVLDSMRSVNGGYMRDDYVEAAPWDQVNTNVGITSGTEYETVFRWPVAKTIDRIVMPNGATAAVYAGGGTGARLGLSVIDPTTYARTLVIRTAFDSTKFLSASKGDSTSEFAFTDVATGLVSTYDLQANTWYAAKLIIVTTGATPTLPGIGGTPLASAVRNTAAWPRGIPARSGERTGQTDLPTGSVADASIAASSTRLWFGFRNTADTATA